MALPSGLCQTNCSWISVEFHWIFVLKSNPAWLNQLVSKSTRIRNLRLSPTMRDFTNFEKCCPASVRWAKGTKASSGGPATCGKSDFSKRHLYCLYTLTQLMSSKRTTEMKRLQPLLARSCQQNQHLFKTSTRPANKHPPVVGELPHRDPRGTVARFWALRSWRDALDQFVPGSPPAKPTCRKWRQVAGGFECVI